MPWDMAYPNAMMTSQELREALRTANLSKLARHSGVALRTLRRIKNGDKDVKASTIEAVQPHMKASRKSA